MSSVSLSGDEAILLVSTLDSSIRLLDKENGSLYHTLTGHINDGFPVRSTFTNTDAYVVSGDEQGKLFWWGVEKGNLVHSAKIHKERISYVDYHPQKAHLVTASSDKTVKVWENSTNAH